MGTCQYALLSRLGPWIEASNVTVQCLTNKHSLASTELGVNRPIQLLLWARGLTGQQTWLGTSGELGLSPSTAGVPHYKRGLLEVRGTPAYDVRHRLLPEFAPADRPLGIVFR